MLNFTLQDVLKLCNFNCNLDFFLKIIITKARFYVSEDWELGVVYTFLVLAFMSEPTEIKCQ